MKVVLVPGDGIGPEISEAVIKVSQALNTSIEWIKYDAGSEWAKKSGKVFEDGLIEAIEEHKIVLKGPTATPIGTGFRSVNVAMRQKFNTYANIRPIKSFKGVNARYENIDLVIVRENTEDLYKGIEYKINEDIANGVKLITRQASEKICRYAFEYALKNNRKKVTAVHKANIMKYTDGLFLEAFRRVATDYPSIDFEEVIVDNMCMQLVMNPQNYDVLVAPNLYGDIVSDLCAGLVGGLGFAPSGNIGDEFRIYEAVHGSAPDISGQGIANPTALLLTFAMLLEDNSNVGLACKLKQSLSKVLNEGKIVTPDVGGSATTMQFTDAIIENL